MTNFDEIIANANKGNGKTEAVPKDKPAAEKQEAESKKNTYEEKRLKCYAMSEDAAIDAVSSAEKMTAFLDVQSRFERYSLNNNLLIYMQNPNATKIKDFEGWKESELSVKKGAKSFMILEPNPYTDGEGNKRVGYNAKNVFDIADVADVPDSEKPVVPQYDDSKLMSALVHGCPVKIERTEAAMGEDCARYDDSNKVIYYKQVGEFSKLFPALAKAIAHAELAQGNTNYRTSDYEFTARCVAYSVVQKYGRDASSVAIHTVPQRFSSMEAEDLKKKLGEIHVGIKSMTGRMNSVLEVQKNDKDKASEAPAKQTKSREER